MLLPDTSETEIAGVEVRAGKGIAERLERAQIQALASGCLIYCNKIKALRTTFCCRKPNTRISVTTTGWTCRRPYPCLQEVGNELALRLWHGADMHGADCGQGDGPA